MRAQLPTVIATMALRTMSALLCLHFVLLCICARDARVNRVSMAGKGSRGRSRQVLTPRKR